MLYIDLSCEIHHRMPVYPGDEEVLLSQVKDIERDGYTAYSFSTGLHAGTHVDGPMHLLESDRTMAEYPLEHFMGRGCLLDVRGEAKIDYKEAYNQSIQPGDIVLLLTGSSAAYGYERYYSDHPVVTEKLARFLTEKKVKMLGVDMPSPDFYPFPVHKLLLSHEVLILENLTNLEKLLDIKQFEVFAAPLKISAEAGLVRAFAKVLQFKD